MRRFVSIFLVVGGLASVMSTTRAAAAEIVLRPPTTATVVEQFGLPLGPYGPGNRGIDYATNAGDPIAASGPGVVVFAGPVAGSLHVTIDHGGGLLTSYSYVDRVLVSPGDRVEAGETIALSGEGFHFGARIDGRYVDPERLFGVRSVKVVLVSRPDPRDRAAWLDIDSRSEVLEFLELDASRSGRGLLDLVGGLRRAISSVPFTPFRWLDPASRLSELADMVTMVGVLAFEVSPQVLMARSWMIIYRAFDDRECTADSVEVDPPPERRIAVLVDGLDSSSSRPGAMAKLDLGSHGYDPNDVVRFSYNGGSVEPEPSAGPPGWAADLTTSTYSASDTRGSVADNVDDLEALLTEIASANPGVRVDVYGHSLGGLLTRLAVARVAGVGGSVDVGVAVTFGAPNGGAPLAEVVQAFEMTAPGIVMSSVVDVVAPDSLAAAVAIDDLSPGGYAAAKRFVGFPPGVQAVSIGGRGDLLVPGSTTAAMGASNVLIGDSVGLGVHGDLPGMPEADREVALALGGLPPACESTWNRLIDGSVSFGVEILERSAAVGFVVVAIETGTG